MLFFRLSQGSFDLLLDGHFRFTSDGECGMTHYRRFVVSRVATVRGRQVDGEATVVAEAFEAAMLPFLLGELATGSDAWVGATSHGGVRCCGQVAAQFYWCRGRGRLPVLTRGCGLLTLVFPVTSVTPQSVDLELLECVGAIQLQELVIDALSKFLIELTIKRHIIPPCVGCVFGELNHVFVDMLMVVHLECM